MNMGIYKARNSISTRAVDHLIRLCLNTANSHDPFIINTDGGRINLPCKNIHQLDIVNTHIQFTCAF